MRGAPLKIATLAVLLVTGASLPLAAASSAVQSDAPATPFIEGPEPGTIRASEMIGVPVIGKDEDLPALGQSGVSYACNAIGAIADPTARAKIFRMLKQEGFTLPNLIHGSAVVSDSVVLGEGNLVMAGAIVGPSAVLGDGCVVNTGAVVSHDCRLGNHVHIAPGALLAGGVSVGDLSLIGMGCTIYLGLHIGRGVTIYNGQHIFGNLADGAIVK